MEHEQYKELLTGYALDALERAEASSFDEHLVTCPACRAELVELRESASLLAHAAPPVEPSEAVRAKILAAARREAPHGQSPDLTSKVFSMPSPTFKTWANLLRLAAAIVMIALLIGLTVFWQRERRTRQELAQVSRQMNGLQRELARDRDVLSRQREALALLNSPASKRLELAGSDAAQNARGSFVYDQKLGRAILIAESLPATPPDKAYELWFIPKGGSPMAGRIFTVDASGRAMLPQQVPPDALGNFTVAITLEPKRGVAVPTGAIYLSSKS
jgi:anti-sigma-K factor RskA